MGARGPVGKPAELKALEGGRGHRPIDLNQTFRPEVGVPDAPKWLTKAARKAWKRLSVELAHYNLLSKVDRDAFASLCQTIGRIELIETSITARINLLESQKRDPVEALMGATPNGMQVQGVPYQMLNREMQKLGQLLSEFGLTPAQRARVSTAIRTQMSLELVAGAEGSKPAAPAQGWAGFPDT